MKKIIIITLCSIFLTGCSSVKEIETPAIEKVEATKPIENTLENLESFDFIRKTKFNDSSYIYSYAPKNEKDFDIALKVSDSDLKANREIYSLEKEVIEIDSVQVQKGFTKEKYVGGIYVYFDYAILAFDFKINSKFYSGEISNLESRPSKEKLLQILDKLLREIKQI